MEFNFQKIVITIAIIIFLAMMIFISIILYNNKYGLRFPPTTSDCPDYWIDLEGEGASCVNTKGLGTCNIPDGSVNNAMDFSQAPFTGSDGTCSKFLWAKGCGVTWDGINSGVSNPCNND